MTFPGYFALSLVPPSIIFLVSICCIHTLLGELTHRPSCAIELWSLFKVGAKSDKQACLWWPLYSIQSFFDRFKKTAKKCTQKLCTYRACVSSCFNSCLASSTSSWESWWVSRSLEYYYHLLVMLWQVQEEEEVLHPDGTWVFIHLSMASWKWTALKLSKCAVIEWSHLLYMSTWISGCAYQ
jgi:hypothetical protein